VGEKSVGVKSVGGEKSVGVKYVSVSCGCFVRWPTAHFSLYRFLIAYSYVRYATHTISQSAEEFAFSNHAMDTP
jgi:hypothetical protein